MKKKVVVYCVKNRRLLVFRHVDFSFEEVGIQVPAGTVNVDESTEDAVLRELREETGYSDFRIVKDLGVETYNMAPYRDEIQERHFFLVDTMADLPERWLSQEDHDGATPPTRFECFWIPLESGHVLQSGQGVLLHKINE